MRKLLQCIEGRLVEPECLAAEHAEVVTRMDLLDAGLEHGGFEPESGTAKVRVVV